MVWLFGAPGRSSQRHGFSWRCERCRNRVDRWDSQESRRFAWVLETKMLIHALGRRASTSAVNSLLSGLRRFDASVQAKKHCISFEPVRNAAGFDGCWGRWAISSWSQVGTTGIELVPKTLEFLARLRNRTTVVLFWLVSVLDESTSLNWVAIAQASPDPIARLDDVFILGWSARRRTPPWLLPVHLAAGPAENQGPLDLYRAVHQT